MYIFFCEQIGTLKYLEPVLDIFIKKKIKHKVIINFEYLKKRNYFYIKKKENIINKIKSIKKNKIKKIILSLTINSQSQKKLINFCENQNIESIGIIDFWTNIKERLQYKGKSSIPNKILSIDNFTLQSLLKLGISKNKIFNVGHPLFEKLEKMSYQKKNNNLLFISQPVSTFLAKKFNIHKNFFFLKYKKICKEIESRIIFIIHPHDNILKIKKKREIL